MRAQILLLIAASGLILTGVDAAEEARPPAEIKVGGSTIEVTFAPGPLDLPQSKILEWISNSAHAVAAYFGHYPVPHARIFLRPAEGRSGVFNGTTYGSDTGAEGAFTRISLGQHTEQEALDNDWMMTHELIHMAFPDITGRQHHWIEEGIATYVEPIARAQTGRLKLERVWGDMARYMPQGLPRDGDHGLDNTRSWANTYWGGALFCLVADVQIHERTHNRKGLQDALRAVVSAGGSIEEEWPIEHVFEVGDKATGTTVLTDLYNQMKATPVQTDLSDLWRRLGIEVNDRVVSFNDKAPLAKVRQSITAARKGTPKKS